MTQTRPVLLLTRPKPGSDRVVADMSARGLAFDPVISPIIGITPQGPLPDMTQARGVIFTSANAVRVFEQLGGRAQGPAYTVGRATCDAAQALGFAAQSVDGNAETLIAWLKETRPEAPLIHLRGTHTRGDVAGRLTAAGLPTRAAVIYDQPAVPLTEAAITALGESAPVVVPLYSPRSAALFAQSIATMPVKAPLLVAAFSEAVVKAVQDLHITDLRIAARPDSASILPLVAELLGTARNKQV